jgi:hypothetical protein
MFNLILRDGAPENAGHYEGIETTVTTLKVGQAVHIASGKAVLATGASPIYGIVSEPTKNGVVTVLKVTPDMIFKCPTSAAPAAKGAKVTLNSTADGVTATAVASGKFGATVVETLGATAGGLIEVRFEN